MESNEEIHRLVKSIALKNASEHFGKTSVNIVLSRIISLRPELKNDIRSIMKEIITIVDSVNQLTLEQQKKSLDDIYPLFNSIQFKAERTYKEHQPLPKLPGRTTKVVTRFPPEPNGYAHIGHAKAAIIDEEYARMYNGMLILRFDDTNPINEKLEYYQAIKSDLEWLEVKPDIIKNTSDDILILQEYGKRLTRNGNAYVCICGIDEIHKFRMEQIECPCRRNISNLNHNLERLDKIFSGVYHQNEAIIRFKGNMQDKNTVMRDPTLFRIIEFPHPLLDNKIQIWPTYDFAAPVEDSLDGVTHALRTKEYELRNMLYLEILDRLQLRKPIIFEFSRLEFDNIPVSKRKIKQLIDNDLVSGWDDPRLLTLSSMRKRGFDPRAIRKFILSLGLTLAETKPPFQALESANRKIIDPKAIRLFFVNNPIMLIVEKGKDRKIILNNHPTTDLGTREVDVSNVFYISLDDSSLMVEGEELRLMDLYNIKIIKIDLNNKKVITASYLNDNRVRNIKKIHWVSYKDMIKYNIIVPKDLYTNNKYNLDSLIRIEGYAESFVSKLKPNTPIQFIRFGFCRTEKKCSAIFTHR